MTEKSKQDAVRKRSWLRVLTWFRLSLRELLLIVALAAVWFGWSNNKHDLQKQIMELQRTNIQPHWQVFQVTGPPNTTGPGDIPTAWASASRDGMQEWLDLEYDCFIRPKSIEIHETYNPGSVFKVTAFGTLGNEVVIWQGTDPVNPVAGCGIATIPVSTGFPVNRIKVYLDSPKFPGWNEIDAVGIVDRRGNKHWASHATASSCYDTQQATAANAALRKFTTTQLTPFITQLE